jgi:hypothetical protein
VLLTKSRYKSNLTYSYFVKKFLSQLWTTQNDSGWLLVTAGFGSASFEAAAHRVARQAAKLPNVSMAVAVTTSDLPTICPRTSEVYGSFQNEEHPGWGYWAFKSEIVNQAFAGYWGNFEGVIWVDSGCEVCITPMSNRRFWHFRSRAIKLGASVFSLVTPEFKYTKKSLFDEFPHLDPTDPSDQIQATWFILHGDAGKKIARRWLEITLKSVSYSNDEPSPGGESKEFVSHRHDQSIFSLVCKSEGVNPMKYTPATGTHSIFGRIRALWHPIWVSRNRTGNSVLPKFLQ